MTKLLTLRILFTTAVNAELVTKPLILGMLPSISLTLVLWSDFLTRLQVSGIFFFTSVLSVWYLVLKINVDIIYFCN